MHFWVVGGKAAPVYVQGRVLDGVPTPCEKARETCSQIQARHSIGFSAIAQSSHALTSSFPLNAEIAKSAQEAQ